MPVRSAKLSASQRRLAFSPKSSRIDWAEELRNLADVLHRVLHQAQAVFEPAGMEGRARSAWRPGWLRWR